VKPQYRIYVLGAIPADIEEQIAGIHAAGILRSKLSCRPELINATPDAANGHNIQLVKSGGGLRTNPGK